MVLGRQRRDQFAGERRDVCDLHDTGARSDDDLLGARVEYGGRGRFVSGGNQGDAGAGRTVANAATGRGRRAIDHRPAAASDDFVWTGRHVVRRSRRHGAADISVVFGDERSDGVADRWRHVVQLHDAVVDGGRELLGPRHEQRRHRGLDDGDDHDLGAAAPSATAPAVTSQPLSQTISSGQSVTVSVGASGTAPFSYQWYIGASGSTAFPVTGATSASYTTPALTTTTLYWVRVSNAAGTTDSGTATITVNAPAGIAPAITAQPQGQTITSGQATALSVAVSGTGPLSYQWYIGASGATAFPVTGATSASYTTPALTTTTVYWVRVSNAFGVADSVAATITVVADMSNAAFEDQVLVLVNQRRAAGATCGGAPYAPVAPITMNGALRTAARLHSQDMAAQNYFSHTSLDGRTLSQRLTNAGYAGAFPWGENIAAGQPTPQAVVDAWMSSPGHCTNIMNGSYRAMGVGYAFRAGSTYGHYWTQDFGGS